MKLTKEINRAIDDMQGGVAIHQGSTKSTADESPQKRSQEDMGEGCDLRNDDEVVTKPDDDDYY